MKAIGQGVTDQVAKSFASFGLVARAANFCLVYFVNCQGDLCERAACGYGCALSEISNY